MRGKAEQRNCNLEFCVGISHAEKSEFSEDFIGEREKNLFKVFAKVE